MFSHKFTACGCFFVTFYNKFIIIIRHIWGGAIGWHFENVFDKEVLVSELYTTYYNLSDDRSHRFCTSLPDTSFAMVDPVSMAGCCAHGRAEDWFSSDYGAFSRWTEYTHSSLLISLRWKNNYIILTIYRKNIKSVSKSCFFLVYSNYIYLRKWV